jgi:dTDP-4-dehydrorhamnose reductase
MKIFGIGITGLVGSRIVELLEGKHEFTNLSLETGANITDPSTLSMIRNDTEHQAILHLAAKADVDGCEQDKELGEGGAAYKINVLGTQNVVDAAKITKKKIIYISTDFVFDGEKPAGEKYSEEDVPNPGNWYARTKYLGEEVVKNSGLPYVIMRIAYPYRKEFEMKKDFVRAILWRLQNNQAVAGVTDHLFCPTYIDDIAYAFEKLVSSNEQGIFHVVGSESLTPYDAAIKIASIFGCDTNLINKSTRAEYFKGKAARPFNLSLRNDKIKKLGILMRGFEEGLQKLL